MSRYGPGYHVENRSADLISQAISGALDSYASGKQRKKAEGQADEDRSRAQTVQNIGLAREGIHLQPPGALPPQFDINVSGGTTPEDVITRALAPTSIDGRAGGLLGASDRAARPEFLPPSESGRATPITATPSRNLTVGDGYYVDQDERAANTKRNSAAQFEAIMAQALGKARAEDTVNPGARQADLDYKRALTGQATAQATATANRPIDAPNIDPLSPEGIAATRGLKAFEAGLKPEKPTTGIAALPPAQATQVRVQQGALLNMRSALNELQKAVKEGGMALAPGAYQAKIRALQANAQIQFKEAANLGALSGPDMGLVESALGSATNPMQLVRGASGGVLSSLDAAQQSLDARARTMETVYGVSMPAGFTPTTTPIAPPPMAPSTRQPLGIGRPKAGTVQPQRGPAPAGPVNLGGDTAVPAKVETYEEWKKRQGIP